jgi:hypothetical protein
MIKQCAVVLALAALGCGGGSKSATKPAGVAPPLSECAMVGAHLSESVMKWKEPPPTTKENVAEVITTQCEKDQWSAEAKKCFGAITDEDSAKPCIETLSKQQHDNVMNAMEAKFDHKKHEHEGHDMKDGGTGTRAPMPTGSPSPAPPPKGPAKGDPCEGGE